MSGLMIVGDVHGNWKQVFRSVERDQPSAVLLLGDLDLDRPLREAAAPILRSGARLAWIPGNHDSETGEAYDRLWGDVPDWSIHGRFSFLGGRVVAGCGGIFKGRAWYPKEGQEEPAVRTRRELLRHGQEGQPRFRGGVPLRHRDTILPEDFDTLRAASHVPAEILATHEAPTSNQHGFGALDDLARDLGVRLVVHGHHHKRYEGCTRHGARVIGLGKADCLMVRPGDVL